MFENLPLHPAIVHLPIGIMMLLPIVTSFLVYLFFKGKVERLALLVLTLMHLILVGASYAALETGEDEEHRVEQVVNESLIEAHEERAEVFMVGAVVALIVSLALAIPGFGVIVKPALAALMVAQLVLLVLGYRVGHSGGEMVYLHGAANAYINTNHQTDGNPKIYQKESGEKEDDD